MNNASGPPPGVIIFEILMLGALAMGIRAGYRHWRRGPDLPNSIRYGAVGVGLCCAGVIVWIVAALNFHRATAGAWVALAMFALAAPFGAAGRLFFLSERHRDNRYRQELGLSGRRWLVPLFVGVWVGYVVILFGGWLVLSVAFVYGGRTTDSGFDRGASAALLAWTGAMMLAGAGVYLRQRRSWRREDQRLRAEERGERSAPQWLARVWAIAVMWVLLGVALCFIAAATALLAGHAASETRLGAGLDGVGYGIVFVVGVASAAGGVVHCGWQMRRLAARREDGEV